MAVRCSVLSVFLASSFLVIGVAAAQETKTTADLKAHDEALKAKGIKRLTTYLALNEEVELNSMLRDAQKFNKGVIDATKEMYLTEAKAYESKRLVRLYMQQNSQLRAQFLQTNDVGEKNQLIVAMNELDDRIKLLEDNGGMDKALKDARGKVNQAREAYVDHLLAMRKLAETIEKKVAELAADPEVVKTIKQLNKDTGKEFAMVESKSFQSSLRSLKTLEDKVLSETIDLQKEASGLFNVSVVINGKYKKELSIDTGASLTVLPYKLAKEVGVEPTAESQTIQVKLADGRIIDGVKLVTCPTIRIGKFTVDNVETAVMPENLPESMSCIGQSFLENFSYRIDSDSHKMTMTKVETPSVKAPVAPK